MRFENEQIRLPEGEYIVQVQFFEENDRESLWKIYKKWRELSLDLASICVFFFFLSRKMLILQFCLIRWKKV